MCDETLVHCSILCTSVLLLLIKYSFHIYKHVQSSLSSYTCITNCKNIYKINEKDDLIQYLFYLFCISFLHPLLLVIMQQFCSLLTCIFFNVHVQFFTSWLNPVGRFKVIPGPLPALSFPIHAKRRIFSFLANALKSIIF